MMTTAGARRTRLFLSSLIIAFITTASLVSCEDIINSIFNSAAPTSLKASDGKYADRIEVSWTAPNLSGENREGQSVTGYVIEWSGPDALASGIEDLLAHQTSYTIMVDPANRAEEYVIEVTTEVDGQLEGSSSDTGFALETYDLIWKDGGADYSVPGADRWYVTMLQRGFRYDFTFEGEETGWIQFYEYGSLDVIHETGETGVSGESNSLSWVCNENGDWHKFYVRVVSSSLDASFHASYGF